MFQLQTEHTTYQHSWRLVAALVTVILAAILVARVFPMRRFPQIASLPPISDARAWGAYPRLNYRLPTLSGNRFIPTSLSSDGEQLGGYALTPDGHGAIISIFSLETMANQRIGVYHLSQPAKLPAIWVGDNYALIISPDHKLVTCYNVLTHT